MKQNKGVIGLGLILAIVLGVALVVGGGAYFFYNRVDCCTEDQLKEFNKNPENQEIGQINQNQPVDENSKSDCTSNSTPSIKVLSPNGGESYTAGQKITVKWDSKCIDSNKKILIGINKVVMNQDQSVEDVHSMDTTNSGSYTWLIPKDIPVGQYEVYVTYLYGNGDSAYDKSDSLITINSAATTVSLANFSSKYISPYPGQWPPVVQHSTTAYSCSKILRDVFDAPTTLTGKQKTINGRTFCLYSFSDVGAGHAAGVYTYITAGLNGIGSERVDFRLDWPNGCGGYGGPGDKEYDQCKKDQSTFFNNLDAYIASLM